ncbi:MAG: hypothetical protein AAFR38_11890 [Planctomycetota bacterium]
MTHIFEPDAGRFGSSLYRAVRHTRLSPEAWAGFHLAASDRFPGDVDISAERRLHGDISRLKNRICFTIQIAGTRITVDPHLDHDQPETVQHTDIRCPKAGAGQRDEVESAMDALVDLLRHAVESGTQQHGSP